MEYTFQVDGTKDIIQLIEGGNFDELTDRLNNFTPSCKTQRVATGRLFTFSVHKTTEEIIKEMEKESFKPAAVEDLLSFATEFPGEQKKVCIVALGSIANDTHTDCECFASLGHTVDSLVGFSGKTNRTLPIQWNRPTEKWYPSYYFLGIK